ncbi:MAG: MarR family transcriptional regulator [Terriglobales bacterium]
MTRYNRPLEAIALSDYQSLAELRYQIRRFVHFSEQAARKARIEPRQHQLLLALKGLPEDVRPSIGVLAERLQIEPHSAVELVNRLAKKGFVRRRRDGDGNSNGNNNNKDKHKDRRQVLLDLTPKSEKVLRKLSLHHRAELRTAGPALMVALLRVLKTGKPRRNFGKT